MMGARKMCRCFEYDRNTRKPMMKATFRRMKTVSSTEFVPRPRGCNAAPIAREAKGSHDDP